MQVRSHLPRMEQLSQCATTTEPQSRSSRTLLAQSQCCTMREAPTVGSLPTTPKNSLAPRSALGGKPMQPRRPSTAPDQSVLKNTKPSIISSPTSLALVLRSWRICPRPLPGFLLPFLPKTLWEPAMASYHILWLWFCFPLQSILHVNLSITFKNATATVQHLKLLTFASQVLARGGSILS